MASLTSMGGSASGVDDVGGDSRQTDSHPNVARGVEDRASPESAGAAGAVGGDSSHAVSKLTESVDYYVPSEKTVDSRQVVTGQKQQVSGENCLPDRDTEHLSIERRQRRSTKIQNSACISIPRGALSILCKDDRWECNRTTGPLPLCPCGARPYRSDSRRALLDSLSKASTVQIMRVSVKCSANLTER